MFEEVPGFVALLGSNFRSVTDCQDCRYSWSPRMAEAGESPAVELRTTHRFDLFAHRETAAHYVVIYRDTDDGREVVFMWRFGGEHGSDTVTIGPLSATLH